MPVFMSKKKRAEMRKRRQKKLTRQRNESGEEAGFGSSTTTPSKDTTATASSATPAAAAAPTTNGLRRDNNPSKRKRSSDSSSDEKPAVDDGTVVRIPDGLTGKEIRKFRKDARRKARADGRDDSLLEFVTHDGKPARTAKNRTIRTVKVSTMTEEAEADGQNGQEDASSSSLPEKKRRKREHMPKVSFPRINDLLAAHEQTKAKEKELESSSRRGNKTTAKVVPPEEQARYVALDCEMVGIGSGGKQSALARVSLTSWDGSVLLDTFVQVPDHVTDFRTHVSGVRPRDIKSTNDAAMELHACRRRVGELLRDKILVGHALKNDLDALMLDHPRHDIRDTARYRPFMRPSGRGGGKMRPRKLRDLVREHVDGHEHFQAEGEEHCSVDDARATMRLYRVVKDGWDGELRMQDRQRDHHHRGGKGGGGGGKNKVRKTR